MSKILEIREFVDEAGNIINHNIIDIENETKETLEKINILEEQMKKHNIDSNDNNNQYNKFDNLKKSLLESLQPQETPLDENLQLVRDLAECASKTDNELLERQAYITSLINQLESEEMRDELSVNKKSNDLQSDKTNDKNLSDSSIRKSGGWNKGFLKTNSKEIVSQSNSKNNETKIIKKVEFNESNNDINSKSLNKKSGILKKTNESTEADNDNLTKKNSSAFTGKIVERFP